MHRRNFLAASAAVTSAAALPLTSRAQATGGDERHFLEWRTYRLGDAGKQTLVAKYLEAAALPAWQRMGLGPVGAFREIGENAGPSLHVLLDYPSATAFAAAREKLEADPEYQKNAVEYFAVAADDPAFERIDSTLMIAFAAMPQVKAPERKPSVFELRTYYSFSEERARAKIKMFNSGEIPIFTNCGFESVFYGEALVGADLPHLKYMLAAPDMDANRAGWRKFIAHPDWAAMKDLPEYKNTVSKVQNQFLESLPFSQV